MLSTQEMAATLRAMLPLLRLPSDLGDDANFALCVDSPADAQAEIDEEVIGARLESGLVLHAPDAVPIADAWVRGTVSDWLDLLSDRGTCRLLLGGAPDLAAASVAGFRRAEECAEPALV
jgi:hypothetical protein